MQDPSWREIPFGGTGDSSLSKGAQCGSGTASSGANGYVANPCIGKLHANLWRKSTIRREAGRAVRSLLSTFELGSQKTSRLVSLTPRDLFRRAGGDDLAAALAAVGAEIEQLVATFEDVEVVLDHDHRVAAIDQPLQARRASRRMSSKCRPVVGSSSR